MIDFLKYQSLGNDFILLDCLDRSDHQTSTYLKNTAWQSYIQKICDRHYGIGADGVLVIRHQDKETIEVILYNADGSIGKKCLNGLRCTAHHLFTVHQFSQLLSLSMNNQIIKCQQINNEILLSIDPPIYQGKHTLTVKNQSLTGHIVDVGNPHFVILEPTSIEWLQQNGKWIESHHDFPDRTNVEFVWLEQDNIFQMLVFERGCGMTLACGSGAAAALTTLQQTKSMSKNSKIQLHMPGGSLISYVDDNDGQVIQIGSANLVFTGNLPKI